jgi:hypothetical protein
MKIKPANAAIRSGTIQVGKHSMSGALPEGGNIQ